MGERWRAPRHLRTVSCELVREALSALIDGEWSPLAPGAAAAHVAGCVGSLTRRLRVHAYVPAPQPPAELLERLGCSASAAASVPPTWAKRGHGGRRRLVRATQWAAAVVPVCVAVPALALGAFAHVHVVGSLVPSPCIASIHHAIGHH